MLENREEAIIKKYNDLKERKSQLQAKLDLLMSQMKEKYGVSTVEELRMLRDEKLNEIDTIDKELIPLLDKLEKVLGIGNE